jgi:hypothetical protein
VALVALAVLVGSAGVSFATTQLAVEPGVIEACYVTKTGVLRKVEKDAACVSGETRTAWNTVGPKGEPGEPFRGTFASPNGLYSISVTNAGIELRGPSASVELDGGTVQVSAPVVQLNGCSRPVARVGDTAAAAAPGSSVIVTGSPNVCAG